MLEQLFGEEWFISAGERNKKHPAYRKWLFCSEMIARNGKLSVPLMPSELFKISSLVLDGCILVECSGGDVSRFGLGDFAGFGDEKVQRRIRSIIGDYKQFNSLMTELALAAWCYSKGYAVTPYEETGFPDFRIDVDGLRLPVIVECKNIEEGTGYNRFKSIVSKANRQIKSVVEECYGILFVDVSSMVECNGDLSDDMPESVNEIINIITPLVSRLNSSISRVVLFWDEFFIINKSTNADKSGVFLRRRSCGVEHANPKNRLPSDLALLDYGVTIASQLLSEAAAERQHGHYVLGKRLTSINRNTLCRCGSKKRFKHCCGVVK